MRLGACARTPRTLPRAGRACSGLCVLAIGLPWQCSLIAPPGDRVHIGPSAANPKTEEASPRVAAVPPSPPRPPMPMMTLREEVVIKAMDAGQPAFLRCWARAQRVEIGPIGNEVRLKIALDEQGRVTAAQSDSESQVLASCLAVVARRLPFPAPGRPAVVELPLMFR
jgi:hypothetical protein